MQAIRQLCGTVRQPGRVRTALGNFTVLYIVDLCKGSEHKKIIEAGHQRHPLHGLLKTWSRGDIERLMRKLTIDGYIQVFKKLLVHYAVLRRSIFYQSIGSPIRNACIWRSRNSQHLVFV